MTVVEFKLTTFYLGDFNDVVYQRHQIVGIVTYQMDKSQFFLVTNILICKQVGKPRIAFIGVLISCDIFDRNADLRRSDSSAFCLASTRSPVPA